MQLRLAIAALVAFACHGEDKTPPKIEYKLQFEMLAAELQHHLLDDQLKVAADKLNAIAQRIQAACGANHLADMDKTTAEYVCTPKPAKATAK